MMASSAIMSFFIYCCSNVGRYYFPPSEVQGAKGLINSMTYSHSKYKKISCENQKRDVLLTFKLQMKQEGLYSCF